MGMSWQDRLRELGERLTSGAITTAEYREQSEEILAEADREAAEETQPTTSIEPPKVRIPMSAAWEAPSGEMTQIVGTDDRTSVVNTSIADQLDGPEDPAD
jgi:hypothetical protein